jgi:hypothetical protein
MTTAVLGRHPAARHPDRQPHLRLVEKVTAFGTLMADSIRLAHDLEAAPTTAGRQKLTDRFIEAHRAA